MKIKTQDLIGPALDWAVGTCEGHDVVVTQSKRIWIGGKRPFDPSTDWSDGGPIIEREGIRWNKHDQMPYAWTPDHEYYDPLHEPMYEGYSEVKWRGFAYGPTLLIAAMRCRVASKLGDEVDVPEELL